MAFVQKLICRLCQWKISDQAGHNHHRLGHPVRICVHPGRIVVINGARDSDIKIHPKKHHQCVILRQERLLTL